MIPVFLVYNFYYFGDIEKLKIFNRRSAESAAHLLAICVVWDIDHSHLGISVTFFCLCSPSSRNSRISITRTWTTNRTGRLTIKPLVSRFSRSNSNSNRLNSNRLNSNNSNGLWTEGRKCTVLRTITRNCFNPFSVHLSIDYILYRYFSFLGEMR